MEDSAEIWLVVGSVPFCFLSSVWLFNRILFVYLFIASRWTEAKAKVRSYFSSSSVRSVTQGESEREAIAKWYITRLKKRLGERAPCWSRKCRYVGVISHLMLEGHIDRSRSVQSWWIWLSILLIDEHDWFFCFYAHSAQVFSFFLPMNFDCFRWDDVDVLL